MSFHEDLLEKLTEVGHERGWFTEEYEVYNWEDRTEWSGGCETCALEEAVVDLSISKNGKNFKTYTYYGSFGDLIHQLG